MVDNENMSFTVFLTFTQRRKDSGADTSQFTSWFADCSFWLWVLWRSKSCILVLVPHHILGPHPGNQTPLPLLRSESRNEIYRFQISGGGIAWPSLIPSEGPPCSKPSSARLFHPHTHVLPCQAPVCRYEIRESGRDWRPLPAYSVFSGVTCLSSSLPRLISQPLSALTTSVSRNISK